MNFVLKIEHFWISASSPPSPRAEPLGLLGLFAGRWRNNPLDRVEPSAFRLKPVVFHQFGPWPRSVLVSEAGPRCAAWLVDNTANYRKGFAATNACCPAGPQQRSAWRRKGRSGAVQRRTGFAPDVRAAQGP